MRESGNTRNSVSPDGHSEIIFASIAIGMHATETAANKHLRNIFNVGIVHHVFNVAQLYLNHFFFNRFSDAPQPLTADCSTKPSKPPVRTGNGAIQVNCGLIFKPSSPTPVRSVAVSKPNLQDRQSGFGATIRDDAPRGELSGVVRRACGRLHQPDWPYIRSPRPILHQDRIA